MSKEIEEIKAQLGKCLCCICLVKDGQIKYLLSCISILEEHVNELAKIADKLGHEKLILELKVEQSKRKTRELNVYARQRRMGVKGGRDE